MEETFLIVGLGNIGKEYELTRHNIGFLVIDKLLKNLDKSDLEAHPKLKGDLLKINYKDKKIILLKPTTFMNLSGQCISLVKNYYKIDINNILIIHDELNMHYGKIKLQFGRSNGGHNGIKSIDKELGNNSYGRLKMGIRDISKDKINSIVGFVLGKFNDKEMGLLEQYIDVGSKIICSFVENGLQKTMNKYNNYNIEEFI